MLRTPGPRATRVARDAAVTDTGARKKGPLPCSSSVGGPFMPRCTIAAWKTDRQNLQEVLDEFPPVDVTLLQESEVTKGGMTVVAQWLAFSWSSEATMCQQYVGA